MKSMKEFLQYIGYTEKEQQQVENYLEGKIDDEQVIIKTERLTSYILDDMVEHYLDEEEAFKDITYTKRLIYFLFKKVPSDILSYTIKDLDYKLIERIYPEFYNEVITKHQLIDKIFNQQGYLGYSDREEECISRLIEKFDIVDVKDYLSTSEVIRTNGYYHFSYNLMCLVLQYEIKEAFELEDEVRAKQLILEFLESLASDYLCNDAYISRHKDVDWNKFKTHLEPRVKQTLLALVDTGENWATNIEILKENLVTIEGGAYSRQRIAFMEVDEAFKDLYYFVRKQRIKGQDNFIQRIEQLVLELVPDMYIEGKYFRNCKHYCHFKDSETALQDYEEACKKEPELKDVFGNYLVTYTIEHLHCNRQVHKEVIKAIASTYGPDFLIEHFRPKGNDDRGSGYHAFRPYTGEQRIKEQLEDVVDKAIVSFAEAIGNGTEAIDEIVAYIKGNTDKINLKKVLKKEIHTLGSCNHYYVIEGAYLERIYRIVMESKNKGLKEYFLGEFVSPGEDIPHKYILDLMIKNLGDVKELLKLYIESSFNMRGNEEEGYRYRGEEYKTHIFAKGIAYLEARGITCIAFAKGFSAKLKVEVIEGVYYDQEHITYELDELVACLKDKNKSVHQTAQRYLFSVSKELQESTMAKLLEEIHTNHPISEALAVEVLCTYNNVDIELLRHLYNQVSSNTARELIADKLGLSIEDIYQTETGKFDIETYLESVYTEPKKFPIELINLKLPQRKDGKDSEQLTKQFILSYKECGEGMSNNEGVILAKYFEEESFKAFIESMLEEFEAKGSKINDKWQLLIPCTYGDKKVVQHILKGIQAYSKGSRQKLAIYMIQALGMNHDQKVLNHLEKLGRTTKFKSIREACEAVLEAYATRLDISKEELCDALIPQYMKDGQGIPFSYGEEVLNLMITEDFELHIQKVDGKVVKSLPKPAQGMEDIAIKQAKEQFSSLKKEIKDMAKLQTLRLQDAFVEDRKWLVSQWERLFVRHTFMRLLGKQVLWGVYVDSQLQKTFVIENGIVGSDGTTIELQQTDVIGLVHPMEMMLEEYTVWKDKLVGLCFNQLDRQQVLPMDMDNEVYLPKDYPRKNPSTIIDRLRKRGWHIGSVRDGGSFNELYKEIAKINLGIEITFDEHPYMGGYGYEADSDDGKVGIEKIEFYRIGILKRGSYIYDELEEHANLRYKLRAVPARIVNEILLQIIEAMS